MSDGPSFLVTLQSVIKADPTRYAYEDVYWAWDESGNATEARREPAPVEAFYELRFERDGKPLTFVVEVRRTGDTFQLDWEDAFQDFLADVSTALHDSACCAVLAIHSGGTLSLPLVFEEEDATR